jgi:hypothetical protein
MNPPRSLIAALVATAAAVFPMTSNAQAPTVELVPVNDVQVFAGADSPCPFDITFTGTGTTKLTTYYDNNGTRSGKASTARSRTPSSAPGTRSSRTARPPYTSTSAAGRWSTRAKSSPSTSPETGSSSGQSGRFTLAADGSALSFVGHSIVDTAALCAALAP